RSIPKVLVKAEGLSWCQLGANDRNVTLGIRLLLFHLLVTFFWCELERKQCDRPSQPKFSLKLWW
ncbi:MAG TPA: hypothetical protein V6C98_16415, partial [Thermosynechococcaceae cyanobacterium]